MQEFNYDIIIDSHAAAGIYPSVDCQDFRTYMDPACNADTGEVSGCTLDVRCINETFVWI